MPAILPAHSPCSDTTAHPDALDAEALMAHGVVQLANHRPAMALPASAHSGRAWRDHAGDIAQSGTRRTAGRRCRSCVPSDGGIAAPSARMARAALASRRSLSRGGTDAGSRTGLWPRAGDQSAVRTGVAGTGRAADHARRLRDGARTAAALLRHRAAACRCLGHAWSCIARDRRGRVGRIRLRQGAGAGTSGACVRAASRRGRARRRD